jgi:large repetitive protein
MRTTLIRRRTSILYAAAVFAAVTTLFGTTALAAPPNLNSNGNATGFVEIPFSYQITANQTITTWGATNLPGGLTVNASTGLISGTPTTVETKSVVLSGTNANGTGTRTVTFTINPPPPPTITSSGTATGTWGVAFSYQITATNGPILSYGTTVSIPGVNFNSNTGEFSGTPTALGTFSGNITATNANGTSSKTLSVTINPQTHTAPTADFSISPTAVWEGDVVTLDGTASHTNPADGSPLIYTWQQQAPSVGVLAIGLTPNPAKAVLETFTAPAPQPLGVFSWPVTFNLKVTDNLVSGGDKNTVSASKTTIVYAKPVADAEPKDAHVNEGSTVILNANATVVQPGSTLAYTWTAPNGITLSDTHAKNPTFIAPFVGVAGTTLTFSLVVTEHINGLTHDQDSASDSMTINIDNVNQPPTATASATSDPNNPASMGEVDENTDPVTLYGFGSDPDGDAISFTWTQVHDTSGAPLQQNDTVVVLSDNGAINPTFTAPSVSTSQQHIDLVFQLITNDGHLPSGPSYVTIRVNNTNDPPVASPAVSPASALEGDLVTLDGGLSSDPNGDALTYTWAQVGTPVVALSDIHAAMPTFTAPVVSAQVGSITLTFDLTVSDGELNDTKPVSVTVAHKNLAPIADAGQPGTFPEGAMVNLDGSNSYDPEGDNLTYDWTQIDGAAVTLIPVTPDNKVVSFIAPDVGTTGGVLHFKLTVTDSHGAYNSANVQIDVTYVNRPPTANPGNDQNVNEGDTVSLSGSGSDPDNNTLAFAWSQFSGPPVTIVPADDDPSKATFVAPKVFCAGDTVVMTLTVDDGYGGTDSKNVTIGVANVNHAPTASGGGNQTNISEGAPVELHATGDDADTEEVGSLAFQWAQTSGPAVTLIGSGKDVSFTAPTIGGGDPNASVNLGFQLLVNDGCGGLATDDIIVNVANIPHSPVAVAQGPATANEGGDNVTLDGTGSSDPDGDSLSYVWTQINGPAVTLSYAPGDTAHSMPMFTTPWVGVDTALKFKLTVSDGYNRTSTAYVTVTVINWHTPPNVTNARADVPVLWPPDHKMLPLQILGVVMPSDDRITIDKITQDEPTNGLGDGDTPIDAIIHHNAAPNNDEVNLRAERSGKGDGRVYKVYFTVADPEQSAMGSVQVVVPKNKKTDVAIDSGGAYDSTH